MAILLRRILSFALGGARMRRFSLHIFLSICLSPLCLGCTVKPEPREEEVHPQKGVEKMKPEGKEERVRPAAKAGLWYEGRRGALEKQLQSFFKAADFKEPEGSVRGLISPHAGYFYSGQTAAYGYKMLEGKKYKRVIVLAPSHYSRFEGGSIMDVTHYETPLGKIPLDRETCDALLRLEYFTSVPGAHTQEHSLELQLPFIQHALEDGFQLIPIVISELKSSWYEPMAKALLPYWDDDTLVVASSDFTHYGPSFGYLPFRKDIQENLEKLDMGAVDKILNLDYRDFIKYQSDTGATICGRKPIALVVYMAKSLGLKANMLKYTTSGEITGDFANSVSYVSLCFTGSGKGGEASRDDAFTPLTEGEKQTLLKLARHTLRYFLETGKKPKQLSQFDITPNMKKELGAFVTLKKKGQLRGCIGYLRGIDPLYEAVIENTISAASKDFRFQRIQQSEEPEIHIEISVLSPVVRVKNLEEIVVGRDGLIVTRGYDRGTLLPQVPVEQGWNRIEFLEHSCRKAGLPTDAYKDPKTVVERYSAQVFSESE